MSVTKIVTPTSITVFANGKILVAGSSHPNFKAISDMLKTAAPDIAKLAVLFDIPAAIKAQSNGAVEVRGGQVFYNGTALHSTLTDRMLAMLSDGFDITPLSKFLEKLMRNPSNRAVTGLYDFLESTHIPITPDGNFLAYKKVRSDYLDIHSGTIRNAPGDAPRVPRNQVDEDPDRTCSHGLHVCSASYLDSFGSSGGNDRVVVVEVNPEDVVAVPRDYNNAKMRCAGYKVIGEVPGGVSAKSVFNKPVMTNAAVPAPAVASAPALDAIMADFEDKDVIHDIDGTLVRFYCDEDGDWIAAWGGGDDLDEDEDLLFGADTLDEAIEVFKDNYMEEVCEYTATVVYLDAVANVKRVTVTVTGVADYVPEDYEFLDAMDANMGVDLDGARVIEIVEGPSKWVLN